ncbi:arylsulfatase [bacterium]|nr:arylsulfatase [bacterium]
MADLQRGVLPIPDEPYAGFVTYDATDPDTSFPAVRQVRPPDGAPNVVVVLIDDCGFGASSAFGGPCQTPTFERLAASGLKYTRFHTAAMCAPTRTALLTGRNHHSAAMGSITETATSAPGYSSARPNTVANVGEVMRSNGFSTAYFGKCHEVPTWETSPIGPFDHWPTGSGYEKFYGFVGGDTDQYTPALMDGTTPIEAPDDPNYHLTEDLAEKANAWMRQQKALAPDKPFFLYFSTGATHAPHHVPKEWIDKYRGQFDQGWDQLRDETIARQKELRVIPQDAELTPRHDEIPSWDEMDERLKPFLARQMEVYAGFLEHTDHQVGRVVDTLEDMGILDDTLIYLIIGDNGASGEGTLTGLVNEFAVINAATDLETDDYKLAHMDELGGPTTFNHYAVGWAHAMDTPYQWTKQVASHWGGTRNGTVVHWPNGIEAKGEIREQFHHVVDVVPTILEAAGLPHPQFVNGVAQKPIEGVSMSYSFDEPSAAERHETQYFEMYTNRGIYHKGWTACTRRRIPWITSGGEVKPFDDDEWELYAPEDWTQRHDLSAEMPDKLRDLQRLWLIQAARHDVLPLDDRLAERMNSELAGRPDIMGKRKSLTLVPGMTRLTEGSVLNVKNKSYNVTADIVVPDGGADGVILVQGGAFGGWVVYMRDGHLKYCYNMIGVTRSYAESADPVPPGEHQVRMEFAYDGDGIAKGGDVTLYVDGKSVGTGRVDRTQPFIFSADDGMDVGTDNGSCVTDDEPKGSFTGTINWVQLDLGIEDNEHLLTAEDRYQAAMMRQ